MCCGLQKQVQTPWSTVLTCITVPIAITALIPIVLFPLEGILDTATVCAQYANNITFLLLGSFFMAVVSVLFFLSHLGKAMERWNLHLRLVYNLLISFGTGRRKILAAFMLVTAILSAVYVSRTW
ncbi:MAG TPA: SLC13 family permease [Thermodesulfobacteriota bacterium]|nr:SLC13 family permease [Thermodesulfobacteriota bacterium]